MRKMLKLGIALLITAIAAGTFAAEPDAALKAKLDGKFKEVKAWASDAAIVKAVTDYNAAPSADAKEMTQDKWKGLNILNPFIKSLSKNSAADFLRSKQAADPSVSEAFVSGADGTKVAFLGKTSGWSHKGKAKHDNPMAGKDWTGAVETDESTGVQQIQISVPVLSGGKPIGSLVVGFAISKLK